MFDDVYAAYTGDVEESTIEVARRQQCSFQRAFALLFEDSQFQTKELKPYDLRNSNVRQLELQRGLLAAVNLSPDSVRLIEAMANEAGIDDPIRKMDKDRNKLRMDGTFDVPIAFGGALLRYLQRMQLSTNNEEFIALQWDAINTMVLALVDFKSANGRGATRLL